MTKSTVLFVTANSRSVRLDRQGNLYTTQALTSNGKYRDVLGFASFDQEAIAKHLKSVPVHDVVLQVRGTFPEDAVFEVQENSDQTEGRGPMRSVGFFDSFEAAFEVAAGRGCMGTGSGDIFIHNSDSDRRRVYSSKAEFESFRDDDSARDKKGERIYSSYFGLSGKYFHIRENLTDTAKAEVDPEFAEYKRLQAIYG